MHPKLKTLKPFLDKLGLSADKIPSFGEYKQAYREKLNLHPNKAGKDNTKVFQEISEAAREVYAFIEENPKLQIRKTTKDSSLMIKSVDGNIDYNINNVVFTIDENLTDAWKEAFERRFGTPSPLKDTVGCQYKTSQLEVTKETTKQRSKVMLQGQAYMTFITFILPDVLEEIRPDAPTTKPVDNEGSTSFMDPAIREIINAEAIDSLPNEVGDEVLVKGFKKLESEILKLRDNLVGIVDTSVNTFKDNFDLDTVHKKLDKLEAVEENKAELQNLNMKIDKVIGLQELVKPVDDDALKNFLESSKTVFFRTKGYKFNSHGFWQCQFSS